MSVFYATASVVLFCDLEMHKNVFGDRAPPTPLGASSAPPDPLAGLKEGTRRKVKDGKTGSTRNILDCNQSNYSSRIIFPCSLFLQAAV